MTPLSPYRDGRQCREAIRGSLSPWCMSFILLVWAVPSLRAEYRPEPGYGSFDKKIQRNREIVANVARQLELPPDLLLALAASESGFAGQARSDKGATGIMQVMPTTAREVASELGIEGKSLDDPVHNSLIGGFYFRKLLARYSNDVYLALAAYNAGPGKVDEWIDRSPKRAGGADIVRRSAFKETRQYVKEVLRRAGSGAFVAPMPYGGAGSSNVVTARLACVVEKGDTLFSIARQNGVGIRDLWRLNADRLDAAADGVFVSPGQVIWMRPLPIFCQDSGPNERGELRASDVEITVNKAARCLELAVGGAVIRHFRVGLGRNPVGAKTEANDGRTPEGVYYVCRKLPRTPYGRALQLNYPNEDDAFCALLQDRITEDTYDRMLSLQTIGEPPPSDTELGAEVCIHGKGGEEDWTDGSLSLDTADANEVFALTPNGARVVIQADDLPKRELNKLSDGF